MYSGSDHFNLADYRKALSFFTAMAEQAETLDGGERDERTGEIVRESKK